MFERPPHVVRLPRKQKQKKMHVSYTLIVSSGETFGPFKSESQAMMFAAVRWPGKVPAWHIEKHSYEERI